MAAGWSTKKAHDSDEARALRRLKWLAVLAPLLFLGTLEAIRRLVRPALFAAWPGYLLLAGAVLLGTLLFAEWIFRVVGRMQARLAQQNRELLALHEAGLEIVGALDLATVLQTVVNEARALVGARYGALLVLAETGGIGAFFTSGMSPEECARLGPIPVEHGLVGRTLTEGQVLRVDDLTQDPRAVGLPPGHPPMRSLLAVPIASRRAVLGNLFLTEKTGPAAFTADDEATLARFATQAALAIENARLHQQVRALATTEERERIARELHDALAQVLGYVNTKAQAVEELVRQGQGERALLQLGQLAEAARAAYADVREGILGLRASPSPEHGFLDTLSGYLQRWQDQSGIAVDLAVEPAGFASDLDPFGEVQLLRIIQEALTNVRKHAAAQQVMVRLVERDGWVEAEVADNGHGFEAAAPRLAGIPRFGLATMRER
ncbi:MAG TPA: GAF domain-containing protein, partial [Thermomicrobiales bacterium]|nr:GAF domain-containing protein [Thermomicrobiales bacterium]